MTTRTPLEVLRKTRELIGTPERWIKQAYTKRVDRRACYCLDGALGYAMGKDPFCQPTEGCYVENAEVYAKVLKALGFETDIDVHTWNDKPRRTHAQVLARLDKAIAKLSK
jgi:hypothetical protein